MMRFLYFVAVLSLFVGGNKVVLAPNVTLFKALFALPFLVGLIARPRGLPKVPSGAFLVAFWLFTLVLLVSAARAPFAGLGIGELYSYAVCLIAAWSAFLYLNGINDLALLAKLLVLAALVNSLLGVAQIIGGGPFYLVTGEAEFGADVAVGGRAQGLFANPNGMAALLLSAFFFSLGLATWAGQRWRLLLRLVVPVFFAGALILTFSRSGVLALLAGLGLYVLRAKNIRVVAASLILIAALGVVAYWILQAELPGETRLAAPQWSENIRWFMLQRALHYFVESPVLGSGAGFYLVNEGTMLHIAFLVPLVEQGIIGWIPFLYLLVAPAVKPLVFLRHLPSRVSDLVWGYVTGYVALALHVNMHGGASRHVGLWLMLGVGFRLAQLWRVAPQTLEAEPPAATQSGLLERGLWPGLGDHGPAYGTSQGGG